MITIAIADDHQMLIDGLRSSLTENYYGEFDFVGTANDGEQLMNLVRLKQPRVVITDIQMPKKDGIEVTEEISREFPHIKVLIMTMIDDPIRVRQLIEAGASGYVLKNSGIRAFVDAIRTVAQGGIFIDRGISLNFFSGTIKNAAKENQSGKPVLSNREKEILQSSLR